LTAPEEHLLVLDLVASYGVVILRTVWGAGRHQHRGAATRTEHQSFISPALLEQRLAELVPRLWPAEASIPISAPRPAA
jgi:hypothetical protein